MSCSDCGHIYNLLSKEESDNLNKYYNDEYGLINLSTEIQSDRPGSNSLFSINRYNNVFEILKSRVNNNFKILDIGCGLGGFLDFLYEKGFHCLYGVDLIDEYVEYSNKKKLYTVNKGSVEKLPFQDNFFDVVVMDQVLEHIEKPNIAFKEINRVLKDNGFLCIGIPDAARYEEFYFFDFYWLLLREHIQHFDLEHINFIASKEDFKLISFTKKKHPIMSNKQIMPILYVLFHKEKKKYISPKVSKNLLIKTKTYIESEKKRVNQKVALFKQLKSQNIPLYIWGIGREFLYLYEETGLKFCNIKALIDINKYKQEKYTLNGMKILSPKILVDAPPNSKLIITAVAYSETIREEALSIGFKGSIINNLNASL